MTESKILHGLFDFQPLLEIQINEDETIISGVYQINELVFGERYLEDFDVKITVTSKYPSEIPQIYIYGNRYDKCEHRYSNGMLCLETEHNLKAFLKENPTLREFLVKFLNPFLVGFLYYEKHGKYLFGERQHGDAGIVEMYQERFGTNDIKIVLQLLEIIAKRKYRGHVLCPCNSGKRMRKCHGQNNLLLNMVNSPEHGLYVDDFHTLSASCKNRRKKKSLKRGAGI